MLIGYMRVSKADGSQALDLQRDDRLGLEACLESSRSGDNLVAWKLDRLERGVGLPTGTSAPAGGGPHA